MAVTRLTIETHFGETSAPAMRAARQGLITLCIGRSPKIDPLIERV